MGYFQPKIPLTFESSDGLTVATFPSGDYKWSSDQPLYAPFLPVVGASYGYDQLGTRTPLKQPGTEKISGTFYENDPLTVDVDTDELIAQCYAIGLGKLWCEDRLGARFWAWARPTAMPAVRWQVPWSLQKGVELAFRRQSDWQAQTPTIVTVSYSSTPHTFTVTNPGSRRVKDAVILLSGTWTTPVTIQNTTNGYGFTYGGTDSGSSSADQVRFDSGANRVDRSTDGGSTWSNVFSRYTPNSGQNQMMILEPGVNSFTITDGGAPNASLVFTFYP